MDDDFIGDAFATDNLWKPSAFFQDPSTYESLLFAPLLFDGMFRRETDALDFVDRMQFPPSSLTILMRQKNLSIVSFGCRTWRHLNSGHS